VDGHALEVVRLGFVRLGLYQFDVTHTLHKLKLKFVHFIERCLNFILNIFLLFLNM
jgi:hypothetical protein